MKNICKKWWGGYPLDEINDIEAWLSGDGKNFAICSD
jgi:hypothetical protein